MILLIEFVSHEYNLALSVDRFKLASSGLSGDLLSSLGPRRAPLGPMLTECIIIPYAYAIHAYGTGRPLRFVVLRAPQEGLFRPLQMPSGP